MFVPYLDAVLAGNEDDRVSIHRNRMTEENTELWVNFPYRNFVGFCHGAKCCLDLPVNCEKSFGNSLPGDTQVRRDRDIRYVVTPQFPEFKPFFVCQHLLQVNLRGLTIKILLVWVQVYLRLNVPHRPRAVGRGRACGSWADPGPDLYRGSRKF